MGEFDAGLAVSIAEARAGLAEGGLPIGSALVKDGRVIARGHNKRVQDGDPVTHAEIDCLRNAGRVGSFRGLDLYSTLMPCYLCAGAAVPGYQLKWLHCGMPLPIWRSRFAWLGLYGSSCRSSSSGVCASSVPP